jgi:hypothetical protein
MLAIFMRGEDYHEPTFCEIGELKTGFAWSRDHENHSRPVPVNRVIPAVDVMKQ